MSGSSSYQRNLFGIVAPSHTFSSPIAPTITDPVMKVANLNMSRRHRAAMVSQPGHGGGPLAGLADATDAVITGAKRRKQPKPEQQQRPQNQPERENARKAMQDSTLDRYARAAEDQASEPAVRFGVLGNDGHPAMSSRDTRDVKTVAATGQTLDIGPEGSFGEPMGHAMGRIAGTLGGFNGGF